MSDRKTIELPLEVRDVVWMNVKQTMPERLMKPMEFTVVSMQITENKQCERKHTYRLSSNEIGDYLKSISVEDIGKTVFRTKEEAEEAYKDYWYKRGERLYFDGKCADCPKCKIKSTFRGRCELLGELVGMNCDCLNIVSDVY